MYTLKNLTPHVVSLIFDSQMFSIKPVGPVARVSVTEKIHTKAELVNCPGVEIPFYTEEFGEVVNLPDPEPGVILIVSRMLAEAAPHRNDLSWPVGIIRDDEGKIIGSRGLSLPGILEPRKEK